DADGAERVAVIRLDQGGEARARRGPAELLVLEGDAECYLDRRGAGVGVEDPRQTRGHHADEGMRQLDRRHAAQPEQRRVGDALELAAQRRVERRMPVTMHVAPQRRHPVEVAPPLRVGEPAAIGLGDDERLLTQPVGHLGEGVPEVTVVPVDEMRIGHSVPPTVRAAVANAASARSMCASVWVAIGVTRSRAVPGGTVGGRMAWASTPSSSSADAKVMARRLSPSRTGTMWASPPLMS